MKGLRPLHTSRRLHGRYVNRFRPRSDARLLCMSPGGAERKSMQAKYLQIGEIVKPQGIRGEVKLRAMTSDMSRYARRAV